MKNDDWADVQSSLLQGISSAELPPLLECLNAKRAEYAKGETLVETGERVTELGLVISGVVATVYDDVLGGRSILSAMEKGELFCDAFSCSREGIAPVSLAAQTDCEVMLIQTDRALHLCPRACGQHQRLCENLIRILADKYVALSRKVVHLSGRTTRNKLLSYLYEQSRRADGKPFAIPFRQQELADYLFVERSGLSSELNKLRREGLVTYEKGLYSLRVEPCAGRDCE